MSLPAPSDSALPAVEELLLHRRDLLLVHRVCAADANEVEVECKVQSEAWYAEADGAMPAWVGIELMAQAVGVYSGWMARQRGEAPRLGYLLGTRSYTCRVPRFPAGAVLRVRARCVFRDQSGLGAFDCTLASDQETLAQATLKVFETEEGRS